MAAGGDNHRLAGADVQNRPRMHHLDASDTACTRGFTIDCRHAVFQPYLDTDFARGGFQRTHQAVAGRPRGGGCHRFRLAGLGDGPVHRHRVHLPQGGVADGCSAKGVRGLVCEHNAMGQQPVIGRNIFIGEGSDDLSIVVTVIRKTVRLHDGPVGIVEEHEIGGVLHPSSFLRRGCRPRAGRCRRK